MHLVIIISGLTLTMFFLLIMVALAGSIYNKFTEYYTVENSFIVLFSRPVLKQVIKENFFGCLTLALGCTFLMLSLISNLLFAIPLYLIWIIYETIIDGYKKNIFYDPLKDLHYKGGLF